MPNTTNISKTLYQIKHACLIIMLVSLGINTLASILSVLSANKFSLPSPVYNVLFTVAGLAFCAFCNVGQLNDTIIWSRVFSWVALIAGIIASIFIFLIVCGLLRLDYGWDYYGDLDSYYGVSLFFPERSAFYINIMKITIISSVSAFFGTICSVYRKLNFHSKPVLFFSASAIACSIILWVMTLIAFLISDDIIMQFATVLTAIYLWFIFSLFAAPIVHFFTCYNAKKYQDYSRLDDATYQQIRQQVERVSRAKIEQELRQEIEREVRAQIIEASHNDDRHKRDRNEAERDPDEPEA